YWICFLFSDTDGTDTYALSLHDALPISVTAEALASGAGGCGLPLEPVLDVLPARWASDLLPNWLATTSAMSGKSPIHSSRRSWRSEEHTSEPPSRGQSGCRFLPGKE